MKAIGSILRFFTAFCWMMSSLYFLLTYVPFTYRQVISINLIPAVQFFAHVQPALLLLSTLLLILFVIKFEKKDTVTIEDRRELIAIGVASLGLSAWLLLHHIANERSALILSLGCLIPPLWLGLFTLRDASERRAYPLSSSCVILSATLAGLLIAMMSVFNEGHLSFAATITTTSAALLFGCLFALVERFINSTRLSVQNATTLYASGLSFLTGIFIFDHFCSSIAFFGWLARFWSFMFAAALSLTFVSVGVRISSAQREKDFPALRMIAGGAVPPKVRVLGLLLFATGYLFFQRAAALIDWNGLIQKVAACGFFLLTFFILVLVVPDIGSLRPGLIKPRPRRALVVALTILAVAGIVSLRFFLTPIRSDRTSDPAFLISKHILFSDESDTPFFAELQSRTNLPRSQIVKLSKIELTPFIETNRPHPLIFIFVIDSLRRDYVSTYNSSVNFTPQIARFGSESTVFMQAFTRYGATALSEPSIWAGRMFPHQLYPQPFENINLLHQLIEREQYDVWLSRDSILDEILPQGDREQELDVGVGTQDLDFCKTSEEIIGRLQKNPNQRPFVYSQSQNIHVSVLARNREQIDRGEKIAEGFHVPYARALQRVDVCFGKFVDQLKSLQLYDQSLIVLTSDHGDSLGEEGRFGHAYTVYPEIVRIPLIIHLPRKTEFLLPRKDLAFSTDIAPTVAKLLGYYVQYENWWEGRPLFYKEDETAPSAPPGPHLVMSSYGPVAGLISDLGDSIELADAINFSDYVYRINKLDSTRETPSAASKGETHRLLKERIDQLYSAFGL